MRKVSAILVAVFLIIALIGCGSKSNNEKQGASAPASPADASNPPSSEASKEPVVLKLGHGTATSSLFHIGSVKFKELIEAKSNGQIKVEIFSDGVLGFDTELVNYMKNGHNVQMGMNGVEVLSTLAPKMKVANMPFIFPTREAAYKILDGELGAEMVANLPKEHGIRVLAYFENGFRHISNSKRAINSPDDLKGLKIRTPLTPVATSIFKALHTNPSPLSWGEVYTALEQKTVDGQENPLSIIYSAKLYEVQDHVAITGHMYSPVCLVISESVWSKLTPDLQQMVQDAANEARDYQRKISADQEADMIKKLEAEGVKITKPDLAPFIELTKDVHTEFDGEYGADFYQKIVDATK